MNMKKSSLLTAAAILALLGCDKDKTEPVSEMQCIPAVYLMEYCPTKTVTHLVRFLKPTTYATTMKGSGRGEFYAAAVIDLPQALVKRDTIFQLQFHYDPGVERQNKTIGYCNANIAPAKMVVYDGVSATECP